MQHTPMKVVLGSSSMRAFVAAPKHLKVLGVVRMGLEYGLLAVDVDGSYLRVNGSRNETLDAREVQSALQIARVAMRGDEPRPNPLAVNKPVVAMRRRRHAVMPVAEEACA